MVQYNPLQYLPSAEELPDSDDTPVDNELQILVPALLRAILARFWSERQDWFLGVNMGVYYEPKEPAIVPDGFLSLGVERHKSHRGRLSYILWEENNVIPQFVLEVVSQTYGQEYDDKQAKYARLGVLYYVVYNPDYSHRDRHGPFEVYRLADEGYICQTGEPVWMPELSLGIGRERGTYEGWTREWLYWYDQNAERYPTPEEVAQQEHERAKRLATKLREMGVDPNKL